MNEMRNADCGMRNRGSWENATDNCLPLTDYAPGRPREGCCLKMPVTISGSGDCPAKHRVSLKLQIGPERLVHAGPKTQSPWRCLPKQRAQGDGEGWRLRPSVCQTKRFVPLLWPKTLTAYGGQSPLPKTPGADQVRALPAPALSTSVRYLFKPITDHSPLVLC
jgi:hypothetical protein